MRWFRLRARVTSWLALFALAAQLALSFGHVHADRFAPAAIANHASTVPSDGAPVAPAKPDGVADDFCAICALLHLAGTALPGAEPSLPLPVVLSQTRLELAATVALPASPHASFQARAPPLA
jgi:hypothetical protein